MFDRDIRHSHPVPRTLQTSKFGPYAKLDTVRSRQPGAVWFCLCAVLVAAIGILVTFITRAAGG